MAFNGGEITCFTAEFRTSEPSRDVSFGPYLQQQRSPAMSSAARDRSAARRNKRPYGIACIVCLPPSKSKQY